MYVPNIAEDVTKNYCLPEIQMINMSWILFAKSCEPITGVWNSKDISAAMGMNLACLSEHKEGQQVQGVGNVVSKRKRGPYHKGLRGYGEEFEQMKHRDLCVRSVKLSGLWVAAELPPEVG